MSANSSEAAEAAVIGDLSADDALLMHTNHQLVYLPGPSMLICEWHQVNLSVTSLPQHLRTKHQINAAAVNRIQAWVTCLPSKLQTSSVRELVSFAASHNGQPFPGLAQESGLTCVACRGCWKKKANAKRKPCPVVPNGEHNLRQAQLQTLNTGNSPVMVAVSPRLPEVPRFDFVRYAQSKRVTKSGPGKSTGVQSIAFSTSTASTTVRSLSGDEDTPLVFSKSTSPSAQGGNVAPDSQGAEQLANLSGEDIIEEMEAALEAPPQVTEQSPGAVSCGSEYTLAPVSPVKAAASFTRSPAGVAETAGVSHMDLLLEMSFSGATDSNVRPQQEFDEEGFDDANHDEDEVLVSQRAQMHQSNFVSHTGMANKYSQFQLSELSLLTQPLNTGQGRSHEDFLLCMCANAKRLYSQPALKIPATPIIVLRMIKTPNPARSPEIFPFGTREPPTFRKYTSHWTRLLLLVVRLATESEHVLVPVIEISAAIKHAALQVRAHIERLPLDNNNFDVQNALLDLSMLLLTHVYHGTTSNLMFAFLTSLCWSESKGIFQRATNCTSMMAGVLFTARLVWLADLWRRSPLGSAAQGKVTKIARALDIPQFEHGFEDDDAAAGDEPFDVDDRDLLPTEGPLLQATEAEITSDEDCTKMIAKMRETIGQLQDGTGTVISEILRLIPLGKKIQDDNPPAIQWGHAMRYLLYRGEHISLDLLRSSVRRRIRFLHDEVKKLMIFPEPPELVKLVLSDLHDNPSEDAAGYSFMSDKRNREIIQPLTKYIFQRVKTSDKVLNRFFRNSASQPSGGSGASASSGKDFSVVDAAEAGMYLEKYYKTLTTLLSTIYLTAGAPARTTELMDLYLENGVDRVRNFYISDGDILLYTRYHKLRSTTGFDKAVMRFLPYPVGLLLVKLITTIRPWALFLKAAMIAAVPGAPKPTRPPQFFDKLEVFGSRLSSKMPTAKHLRSELSRFFSSELQARIHASSYRQLFHAISKDRLAATPGGPAVRGPDYMNMQAAHSAAVGNQTYGRTANDLAHSNSRELYEYRICSRRWHHFLHLTKTEDGYSSHISYCPEHDAFRCNTLDAGAAPYGVPAAIRYLYEDLSSATEVTTCELTRMTIGGEREHAALTPLPPPPVAILFPDPSPVSFDHRFSNRVWEALGRYTREYAESSFKSPEQAAALYQILSGVSPLLVVMGTNAGKTALWMVPAMMTGAKITVVILPLLSLVRNVELSLRERGVAYEIIRDGGSDLERKSILSVNVLVIITETALLPQFADILSKLHSAGRLDRIVLDECHVSLCAADYRPKLQRLHKIFTVGAQVVMLTATLGPTHEKELRNYLGLRLLQTLRHNTYRTNIHYLVRPSRRNSDLEEEVAAFVQAFRSRYPSKLHRIIVYCRTKLVALSCSKLLGGLAYFHDYEHAARDLELFYGDKTVAPSMQLDPRTDTSLICATSALSEGVDLANVRLVIHVDEPYGIVNLVQESGRAGRDGARAFAVVMARGNPPNKRLYKDESDRVFYSYLREEDCATRIFSRVFDGVGYSCRMVRAEQCNYCLHQAGRDSPLLPFFNRHRKRAASETEDLEETSRARFEVEDSQPSADARVYHTGFAGNPLVENQVPLCVGENIWVTATSLSAAYASLASGWPVQSTQAQDPSMPVVQEQISIFEADYTDYLRGVERTTYSCALCSLKGLADDQDGQHSIDACPFANQHLRAALKDWFSLFRFDKWTCCFGCTLPIDICHHEEASDWRVKCQLRWRVQTICLVWWMDAEGRKQLEHQLGEVLPNDKHRYAEYLSRRGHFRGLFAHGAFKVSWTIIQMHPAYRDGDMLSDVSEADDDEPIGERNVEGVVVQEH